MKHSSAAYSQHGFTLIELLIVIAVIGVLAGVVLVVIDPLEQLARSRDTGRKAMVKQLANRMEEYYALRSSYPVYSPTLPYTYGSDPAIWMNALIQSGELRTVPPSIQYGTGTTGCTYNSHNGYCYHTGFVGSTRTIQIHTKLESKLEKAKCPTPPNTTPWFAWSSDPSANGKNIGVVCWRNSPDPTGLVNPGGFTYLD